MRSVADALREESRRRVVGLPPAERLALAFRLGDEAVAAFAAAHRLTPREAARELARRRQAGRRRSRCLADLLR